MRSTLKLFVVFVFVLFSAACCVRSGAQAYSARCDIPFAFLAGNQSMEPGQYTVTRYHEGIVLLQSRNSSTYQLPIMDDSAGSPTPDKLVFTRVGNQSFLREMRLSQSRVYLKWPVSRAQQQQMVMVETAPSTTTVALVRTPR